MKTLTLLVFAISCSLLQLPGSLAIYQPAGKDVLRAVYPNQLSKAALQCLRTGPYSSYYKRITDGFYQYFFDLSKKFNLNARRAKIAGHCLINFRYNNPNLKSCWDGNVPVNLVDEVKNIYDEFDDLSSYDQVLNCARKKDPTPNSYTYKALTQNGINCAANAYGNVDTELLDGIWQDYLTECGYFEKKHGGASKLAVAECFSYGEFAAQAGKSTEDRFTKGGCVKRYVGTAGLQDMKDITNRLGNRLSSLKGTPSTIINCAQKI